MGANASAYFQLVADRPRGGHLSGRDRKEPHLHADRATGPAKGLGAHDGDRVVESAGLVEDRRYPRVAVRSRLDPFTRRIRSIKPDQTEAVAHLQRYSKHVGRRRATQRICLNP